MHCAHFLYLGQVTVIHNSQGVLCLLAAQKIQNRFQNPSSDYKVLRNHIPAGDFILLERNANFATKVASLVHFLFLSTKLFETPIYLFIFSFFGVNICVPKLN